MEGIENMKYTVTMECNCGQRFVGQGEHLVDAVGHMVKSASEGGHADSNLNQELAALSQKAEDVNAVDGVLTALGLVIVDLVDPEEKSDDVP